MQIDVQALKESCIGSDTRFFVGVDQPKLDNIDSIIVDGVRCKDIIFIDIVNGFGIRTKCDVTGKIITFDGEIYYEFFFGHIEIIWRNVK